MKAIYGLLLVLILPLLSAAQNNNKEYLDKYYFSCPKDSAVYYRYVTYDKDTVEHGIAKAYFMNGQQYSEIDYYHGMRARKCTWWHSNGQKSEEVYYDGDQMRILNSWDTSGNPMVVNGTGWYVELNPLNNKLKLSEGKYIKGERDSIWTWWHINGNRLEVSNYKDGNEFILNTWNRRGVPVIVNGEGMYIDYHNEKLLKVKGSCENEKREGDWKWYYDNGRPRAICSYVEGELDGLYKAWHPNGNVKFELNYSEGTRQGKSTWWFWNGQKDVEADCSDGGFHPINSWDINGNPLVVNGTGYSASNNLYGMTTEEGRYVNYKKVGLWKYYFYNGTLQTEVIYDKGQSYFYNAWDIKGNQTLNEGNGKAVEYYNVYGDIRSIIEYKNGLMNGTYIDFFENGDTSLSCNTINNVYLGEMKTYNENGTLSDWKYYHSRNDYSVKEWHENGQKSYEGRITDGVMFCSSYWGRDGKQQVVNGNGNYVVYYDNGNVRHKGVYKKGYKTGIWEEHFEDGSLSVIGKYVSGKKDGKYIFYSENGNVSVEEYYKLNVTHGPYISYYETGKKYFEGEYVDGYLQGIGNYYNEKGVIYSSGYYEKGVLKYSIIDYPINEDPIYSYLQNRAEPINGYNNLKANLLSKTRNSSYVVGSDSIDGVIQIVIVIEKNGSINRMFAMESKLGKYYQDKAVQLMRQYAKEWKPATLNGKPVRSVLFYPVSFDTLTTYRNRFDVKFSQNGKEVSGDTLLIMKRESFSIEMDFPENNENRVEVYSSFEPSFYNQIAKGVPVNYMLQGYDSYREKGRYANHTQIVSPELGIEWFYADSLSHTFNKVTKVNNTLKCYREIDSLSISNIYPRDKEIVKEQLFSIKEYPYKDLYMVFYTRKNDDLDIFTEYQRRIVHIRFE